MPDTPSLICVINPTGGYEPLRALDGGDGIDRPTVQITIRDESYPSGDIRIRAVMDRLDGYAGTVNGKRDIRIFKIQSEPLSLGNDEKGRNLF